MLINYINAQLLFFLYLYSVFSSTPFHTNIWQKKNKGAELKGQSKIYMNSMHHFKGNSRQS